jgi:exonuclease SbcD
MDFYRCARFTVEDGVARGAELVLHAGDVFNGCRPTPTERRLALEAFAPALEAGIPVVVLLGNHDAPRSPSERHALDTLRGVEGLTVVDFPATLGVWRREGQTCLVDWSVITPSEGDLALQIACLPWPNKQLLLADERNRKLEPGELNVLVREKMMDCLRGLATQLIPDVPAVLLGHFSVDVAQAGGMNRLMMLGGDFTLNVHELEALPFDAILLGHIHKPQHLGERTSYCGSPEAVGFGEEGETKGFIMVGIGPDDRPDGGTLHIIHEHIATPFRRFVTLTVGEEWPPTEELGGAIVRVKVPAGVDIDLAALRDDLEGACVHEIRIETERAEAVRRRAIEVSAETSMEDAIRAWLEQNPDLKPMMEELLAEAVDVERVIAGAVAGELDREEAGAP